jgi:hypothetical protein
VSHWTEFELALFNLGAKAVVLGVADGAFSGLAIATIVFAVVVVT